jgi:hypothetical protein
VTYDTIAALRGAADPNGFEIIVVGGEAAVSSAVAQQLGNLGMVMRLGGLDRYETNRALYNNATGRQTTKSSTAIIATGTSFADALSISPLAARDGSPVFLVPTTVSADFASQLKDYGFTHAIIVGGASAVETGAETTLANAGISSVERWSGASRYATSLAIAQNLVGSNGFSLDGFVFATGSKFPDALASGPYAGTLNSPLLLADSSSDTLNTLNWLNDNRASVSDYYQCGGYGAGVDTPQNITDALAGIVNVSSVFSGLPGFGFASGAGAWHTGVDFNADGSFTGYFYDSNMGETGYGYYKGTMYECKFSGQFAAFNKVNDYEYTMKLVYLAQEEPSGKTSIVDGLRIITSYPYGLDGGDDFRLYLPGRATADLPAEFLRWISMPRAWRNVPAQLPFYGLYNVGGEYGFSGGS